MAQPIAAVIVAEAVVPAVVGDTGAGATDVAAGIILAVDMAGTAEDAEHRHSDPVREERNNSALVGELETAPKRTAILETAILLSLAAAVLALFLFVWVAETFSNPQTQAFDRELTKRARLSLEGLYLVDGFAQLLTIGLPGRVGFLG